MDALCTLGADAACAGSRTPQLRVQLGWNLVINCIRFQNLGCSTSDVIRMTIPLLPLFFYQNRCPLFSVWYLWEKILTNAFAVFAVGSSPALVAHFVLARILVPPLTGHLQGASRRRKETAQCCTDFASWKIDTLKTTVVLCIRWENVFLTFHDSCVVSLVFVSVPPTGLCKHWLLSAMTAKGRTFTGSRENWMGKDSQQDCLPSKAQ